MEDSRSVGTYLDASADFAQPGGLLEQLNLEAGAPKRQRGREPADPGSDYDDSHAREHLRSSASPAYAGVQGSLSYRSFCSKAGIRWKRAPDRQTSLKTQPLARSSRAISRPFSCLLTECSALRFVIEAWRFSGAWKT